MEQALYGTTRTQLVAFEERRTIRPCLQLYELADTLVIQGKEENFLCALSNFDVYYVGKHKSPKPFVFAVKSTENISLFESAADYVHYFCCGQSDGETWMQAILLARVSDCHHCILATADQDFSRMSFTRSAMCFLLAQTSLPLQHPSLFLGLEPGRTVPYNLLLL